VNRFSAIIYIGAGVLAWTAVKMVTSEPLLQDFLADYRPVIWAAYVLTIGGVLGLGILTNRRKAAGKPVVDLARLPAAPVREAVLNRGGPVMNRIVLPVDGSANSLNAVRQVVNRYMNDHTLELHLLHVRTPLNRHIAQFLPQRDRSRFHQREAEKAFSSARELLKRHGVPFREHVELGDKASVITRTAERVNARQIVMGTSRKNTLARLLEDSTTNRVLELTTVPVEVVAGRLAPALERYGVPAGIGGAMIALALIVSD
jgi:nucleotide-binding universal stress UspA family protein